MEGLRRAATDVIEAAMRRRILRSEDECGLLGASQALPEPQALTGASGRGP